MDEQKEKTNTHTHFINNCNDKQSAESKWLCIDSRKMFWLYTDTKMALQKY